MTKKRAKKRVTKKENKKAPWFKRREKESKSDWGFVPVNWKGWVALVFLIAINVFAANYFNITDISFKGVSKFLIVFLLSISTFILIARQKTVGLKGSK